MAIEPSVTWKAPPQPVHKGAKSKWPQIAAQLRERPGEWALIATDVSPSVAANIKAGRLRGMEAGAFDATVRANGYENRRVDVYARFVGE